jgi:integrase
VSGKKGRRGWGWIRRSGRDRWHASYVGPDLIRHNAPTTFAARIDAEGFLAAERRLIELGAWTPPRQRAAQRRGDIVTVATYTQQWLDHRTNLKPRTVNHYQALLDRLIKPSIIGPVPLRNLTGEAVRAWHAGLDKSKPTQRRHCYQLLRAALETAVREGMLTTNPCHVPGAAASVAPRRASVILEPAEVAALADVISPQRWRALVLILFWCGPRFGEVIELRRRDIDTKNWVISIERGATHRRGECFIDTPKSGRRRKVVVPPHIREDVANHLERHVAKDADALLFPTVGGGCHLRDTVFRKSYRRALIAIGRGEPLPTIHDARHFAGTMAARVGNLVETMAFLGHSTQRASLIYQQVASGRDVAVAEALSRLAEGDHV